MKLILAGNQREYDEWLKYNHVSRREAYAISGPASLRGYTPRPGDVIRVGTWYMRRDLAEIEDEIRMCTHP